MYATLSALRAALASKASRRTRMHWDQAKAAYIVPRLTWKRWCECKFCDALSGEGAAWNPGARVRWLIISSPTWSRKLSRRFGRVRRRGLGANKNSAEILSHPLHKNGRIPDDVRLRSVAGNLLARDSLRSWDDC